VLAEPALFFYCGFSTSDSVFLSLSGEAYLGFASLS